MKWIDVMESIPENNRNVLGMVGSKNRRVVFYLNKYVMQADDDYDDFNRFTDYDSENDIYYWKEGWYEELEQFQHEYDFVWTPRNVTHWCELPEPPKQDEK